jgi:MFS transporter, Spinster family, sphingosine-1-phosphate transporter
MHLAYRWKLAALIFFASALNYGDRTTITSIFPLLRSEFGLSDIGLAATGSAFLWSYGLCSPLAGLLADRFSRSKMVVWSLFGWSAVTLASALATNIQALFTMRLLLGVAESLYLPAAIALLADHHPASTRAKAIGMHMAGLSTGMVAGGVLSGYLAARYSWRLPLVLMGCTGMALAAYCRSALHDAAETRTVVPQVQRPAEAFRIMVKTPAMLILAGELMLMGIGNWSLVNWLPLYFNETFGMALGRAALFGTVFLQAGATLGVVLGGAASDAVARGRTSVRMLLFGIFYLAAAPALLVFLTTPGPYLIGAAVLGFAILRGMGQVNSNPLVCELLPLESRSSALGVMNGLACLAGAAGVMASGWLKSSLGLAGVFASISLVTVTCGIALIVFSRVSRQPGVNR